MEVLYKPSFVREFQKLSSALQDEVYEKVTLFKNSKNHKLLKVHALKGALKGYHSFSVNYRWRIIFTLQKGKKEAHLHTIGDHSIYQ